MTIIQYRDDIPDWAAHDVDPGTDTVQEVWVEAWDGRYACLRNSEAVTLRHERTEQSIMQVLETRGWTLADVGGGPVPLSDTYIRRWVPIFEHTFWYDTGEQEALALALASRNLAWGDKVRAATASPVTIATTLEDARALGETQRLLASQNANLDSVQYMQCVQHTAGGFVVTLHSRQPTDTGDAVYAPAKGEKLLYQTNIAALADQRGTHVSIQDAEAAL